MAATQIFKVLRRAIPLVDEAGLVVHPKVLATMLNTAAAVLEAGEATRHRQAAQAALVYSAEAEEAAVATIMALVVLRVAGHRIAQGLVRRAVRPMMVAQE